MVDRRSIDESRLERRLRRLEAMIIALLAAEAPSGAIPLRRFFFDFVDDDDPRSFDLYLLLDRWIDSQRDRLPRSDRETGLRVRELEQRAERADSRIRQIRQDLDEGRESERRRAIEMYSHLTMSSLGLDPASAPLHRFLPLRVYTATDDADATLAISEAVEQLIASFDVEFAHEFPAESGSWFKRWFGRTRDAVAQPEVASRLKKLERALELETLQKNQSAIDKNQAEAAAALLDALGSTDEAVCQIGSILLVKIIGPTGKPQVFTRTLTQEELLFVERNPEALKSPAEVLGKLRGCTTQAAHSLEADNGPYLEGPD